MFNQSKIVTVNKCHSEILQGIDKHTLVNAYFGGCNIAADYLNDYSQEGINTFVGEFISSNWSKPYMREYPYSAYELIESPDLIVQYAANGFVYALGQLINCQDCETIFKNSKKSFKGYKSFHVFAVQWSNACCTYYIIREDSFGEAYAELVAEFEADFIIENQEEVTEDTLYNDNGEPINIDNLTYMGEIKLSE